MLLSLLTRPFFIRPLSFQALAHRLGKFSFASAAFPGVGWLTPEWSVVLRVWAPCRAHCTSLNEEAAPLPSICNVLFNSSCLPLAIQNMYLGKGCHHSPRQIQSSATQLLLFLQGKERTEFAYFSVNPQGDKCRLVDLKQVLQRT